MCVSGFDGEETLSCCSNSPRSRRGTSPLRQTCLLVKQTVDIPFQIVDNITSCFHDAWSVKPSACDVSPLQRLRIIQTRVLCQRGHCHGFAANRQRIFYPCMLRGTSSCDPAFNIVMQLTGARTRQSGWRTCSLRESRICLRLFGTREVCEAMSFRGVVFFRVSVGRNVTVSIRSSSYSSRQLESQTSFAQATCQKADWSSRQYPSPSLAPGMRVKPRLCSQNAHVSFQTLVALGSSLR